MSCDFPIAGYRKADFNVSGKRSFQFSPIGSLSGIPEYLPCGKCIGCRLERARIWATRCVHESKMHKQNCFITLTYDNAWLPSDGSLDVRHFQLFMKRLRVSLDRVAGIKLRFYACGEYGDLNKRPHYHALLFGFDFPDKKFYSEGNGYKLYTSKILDGIWGYGDCKIGDLTFETAMYVAKYCLKKVDGAQREAGHYLVYDIDGVVTERHPEFAVMSRRPGIGTPYYEMFGHEIRYHDSIVLNGREGPSIRYYDLKHEAIDGHGFEKLKKGRRLEARSDFQRFLVEKSSPRRLVKSMLKERRLREKARLL